MKKISVIVPVYKVEKYLDRCVSSILAQTYTDFELLLVDDGSPDRCGEMCDEWAKKDTRIKVFHKTNGGLSDARNYALDRMTGDCVAFVDSDDWLDPECLEYQIATLRSVPKADIATFGLRLCWENGASREDRSVRCVLDARDAIMEALYERRIRVCACSKLYKRKVFDNLRYRTGVMMEDEDIIGDVLSRTLLVVVGDQAHYNYLQRDISITHDGFSMKKYTDQLHAMEHLCVAARNISPSLNVAIRRREARDRMSLLRLMRNCDTEYVPLRKELRLGVLSRWRVLFDRMAPMRDKIGILALIPGFWCFAWLWSIYEKRRCR